MKSNLIKTLVALSLIAYTSLTVMKYESKCIPHINLKKCESKATITQKVQKIHELGLTVEEALKQQCDQECESYLQKLKEEIAITDQEWQYYNNEIQQFKQESTLNKPYKSKRKDSQDPLRKLMISCDINPDAVTIDMSNQSGSWAEQRYDGPYRHALHLCKDQTFSFAVGPVTHELMHLKNYDCMQVNLLNELLCARGLNMNTIQSYNCSGLRKGIETRADVMTACQEIELGKNLKECLEQFAVERNVPLEKEREYSYHPSFAKRLQALDATIAYLEVEQELFNRRPCAP